MSEVRRPLSDLRPTPESLATQGLSEVSEVSDPNAPVRANDVHARACAKNTFSRAHTGGYTSDTSDSPVTARLSAVGRTSDVKKEPPTSGRGHLRDTMPTVAGWIDELRDAFGADQIDPAIRAGMAGQPTFWASEAGREVGTRNPERGLPLTQILVGPFTPPSKDRR